jgi:hypothetical protein
MGACERGGVEECFEPDRKPVSVQAVKDAGFSLIGLVL